ncbi:hypothetical protein CDL15_Pgr014420 [Punica granatum]|uniref:Uncharacterized protein n=1 Tax=Punica granatum TaxID=22663 RepID=A0A218WD00_PUNGR|nr:hypothetical protein CDL15_Pgr014420 [Punica granatum]PKI64840.1 hypothetical protein CRG98_014755 [Punica granatum]
MDHMSIPVLLPGDLTDSLIWLRDENLKHQRLEERNKANVSIGPSSMGCYRLDLGRKNRQVHLHPETLEKTVPSSQLIFLRSYPITMIKRKVTTVGKAKKCLPRVDDHPKITIGASRGQSTRGRRSFWSVIRGLRKKACCSSVKSGFGSLPSYTTKDDIG